MKRFFSVLLVALLIITGSFTKVYADPDDEGNNTDSSETFVQEIDPATMDVHYLGEDLAEETERPAEPEHGEDEIVRVSIVLETPATLDVYSAEDVADNQEAMDYREALQDEQDDITKDIEDKIDSELDVQWNLTLAANIISANVEYGDIKAIKRVDGVEDVFVETRYELHDDEIDTSITNQYMTGAYDAWLEDYTGAGSRIAVIDTGINDKHISFDPGAFEYSLEKTAENKGVSVDSFNLLDVEEIKTVLDQLNGNNTASKHDITYADDVYINSKIPFAFNYIDGNYVTDHFSDGQGEHGSHVAGTAAANRYIKDSSGKYIDALDSVYAVGAAPDAQILVMKVFGAGGGAYDSDYFAAIEDAILLKADAINLSLGSANPGFSLAGPYQEKMDKLVSSNTTVIMSAGNSYNWSAAAMNIKYYGQYLGYLYLDDVSEDTTGSPASFINSMAVAAAENIGISGTPLKYNGQNIFYTDGAAKTAPTLKTLASDDEVEFIYFDDFGNTLMPYFYYSMLVGTSSDNGIEGRIVIVNRGDNTFSEKGSLVSDYEPLAMLVANHSSGTITMNLDEYKGTFPMAMISLQDANMIKATATKKMIVLDFEDYTEPYITEDVDDDATGYVFYTGKMKISDVIEAELYGNLRSQTTVTDFSSWGVPGSLVLKPEITAPGGGIWSVNGMTNDDYELMSGTSMAAPHISGMMAVLAEYIRENDLVGKSDGMTARGLMNSLLMSTATPMFDGYGCYYPVFQQGAGLGDVSAAVSAKSYIRMNEGSTLGSGSAADGKVKAELGQDADRTGNYAFAFTINNFSDQDLDYIFYTDIFTQAAFAFIDDDGSLQYYTDTSTDYLDADVTYSYEVHDVDMDGDTDNDDVQAILEYIVGNISEDKIDVAAGEMDGVEGLSSYDAQLLLECIQRTGQDVIRVEAGKSKEISVIIDANDEYLTFRDNGGYVEGYTYVICVSKDENGAPIDVTHSIPILAYYGSWTDPGMTDPVSALDEYYPTGKKSYFLGTKNTNYMELKYPNSFETSVYTGNPYIAEAEFPEDRLAISSDTVITSFKNTYIRNAATTATIVLDEDQNLISSANEKGELEGAFYYVNGGAWYYKGVTTTSVNEKAGAFGRKEGEKFFIGQFAVPEYYALMLDPDAKTGKISVEDIVGLYKEGELGEGSYLGYSMEIDDTAPELAVSFNEEEKKVYVEVTENAYIAYLALMDTSGHIVYEGFVPDDQEKGGVYTYSFDVSDIKDNAVVVFAGDYAGNEDAVLVRIGEGEIIRRVYIPCYRPADSLEPGKEYLFVHVPKEGDTDDKDDSNWVEVPEDTSKAYPVVLAYSQIRDFFTRTAVAEILEDEEGPYILRDEMERLGGIWQSAEGSDGIKFQNLKNGAWLGIYFGIGGPYFGYFLEEEALDFVYQDGKLINSEYLDSFLLQGMTYDSGLFIEDILEDTTNVELYTLTYRIVYEEIDPQKADSVELNQYEATLLLDAADEIQLTAVVKPDFLPDRTVTWKSSDEDVVTVDENGLVKAVGVGSAEVTATSNQTESVSAAAKITVLDSYPLRTGIYAQVAYDEDVCFAQIDMTSMGIIPKAKAESVFYGGGQAGSYIYGNDLDNEYYRYVIRDDGAIEYDGSFSSFTIDDRYAILDAANFPSYQVEVPDVVSGTKVYDYDFDIVAVGKSNFLQLIKGSSLGAFDLYLLGPDPFVAVSFAGVNPSTKTLYYYALSSEGELYVLALIEDHSKGEANLSLSYGSYGKIYGLPMSDDLTAYSMTYAAAWTGLNALFIADNTTKSIYLVVVDDEAGVAYAVYVGSIDGVSNLSTLYDDYYDSAENLFTGKLDEKLSSCPKPLEMFHVDSIEAVSQPSVQPDNAETEVIEETVETVPEDTVVVEEESVETEEVFEENGDVPGSVNAVSGDIYHHAEFERASIVFPEKTVTVESDPQVSNATNVVYTEEVEVKNGYITVKYNPTVNSYVGYESGLEFNAINIDEENGLIRFAGAQLDAVSPNEIIARFQFSKACEDAEFSASTRERNDQLDLNETTVHKMPGTGHRYYLSAWMWSDDYADATVYFTCMNNGYHREKIYATVTSAEKTNADGSREITYTATATFMGREYTDTRKVVIPAGSESGETGESGSADNLEFVGWEWSEDGTTAYAVFKNKETGETVRYEAAMSQTVVEPTETEDGSIEYKASITVGGKTYTDVKKVTLEKKGDGSKDDGSDSSKPEGEDGRKDDSSEGREGKNLSVLDIAMMLGTVCAGIFTAAASHDFKGLIVAAISALLAGFTQGLSGKTVFADKWSIPMAILLALAVLLMLLANRKKKEEE